MLADFAVRGVERGGISRRYQLRNGRPVDRQNAIG